MATYDAGTSAYAMDSSGPNSHAKTSALARTVNFNTQKHTMKEQKKKYLTAKYGHHQMLLIRKRLQVEDWLYDNLRDLYDCKDESDEYDTKLDLEDLLNFETDSERRDYALKMLMNAKQPQDTVIKFVEELLVKANTL